MQRPAVIGVLAILAMVGFAATARSESVPESSDPFGLYVREIEKRIDPRAASALERIDGAGRQLLAARAYLRAGATIGNRWSWTDEQIGAFEGSDAQKALLAEIELVRSEFERTNPGYTLFVNEKVRSLDEQLANWNRTESVAAAAANLEVATRAFLTAAHWPVSPGERFMRGFAEFLESHVPEPTPTLAAPGLSPHGQMSAVDFHVYQGDVPVAEPEAAQIETTWDAQGWTERLAAAVARSGAKFKGPLAAPREPWHYQYLPGSCAAMRDANGRCQM
jgi:hypothetical protein